MERVEGIEPCDLLIGNQLCALCTCLPAYILVSGPGLEPGNEHEL